MKAGVSSYCFNSMFLSGDIDVMKATQFVGKETEADCIEFLSRYWDEDKDVNDQAKAAREISRASWIFSTSRGGTSSPASGQMSDSSASDATSAG